jgi:hypothetical protein
MHHGANVAAAPSVIESTKALLNEQKVIFSRSRIVLPLVVAFKGIKFGSSGFPMSVGLGLRAMVVLE